jgi:hypothetical protein
MSLGFELKKGFLGLGMGKWEVRCDINEISINNKNVEDVLSQKVSFLLDDLNQNGMNCLFVFSEGENNLNLRIIQNKNESRIFLDLDIYLHKTTNLENAPSWIEDANRLVYKSFIASLNPAFLATIK